MQKIKVLIVEDELVIAVRIAKTLIKLGYDAFDPVDTINGALETIEKSRPAVVLMDINLGSSNIDGIQAACIIKERFEIPVIFLTAFSDQATLERAKIAEPYSYIVKPFNANTLKANIEMTLFNHQNKIKAIKE